MSRLEKMSILGIRSFGAEDSDKQVITFFSPLTLILGPNGTGKTTIIECLKYMTTGEMPPGGKKDGAFIHDPKVAKEVEVKAKIILQFKDVKGQVVTAHRNLVGTQKQKRVEMKTVDSLITRRNVDGEKVSISNKCAEMDREMVSLLGVSKAVLDNVIFCHQEEANWPLSEGKALKQKFDDIFASTRYVKALESIKKCRQAQSQVIAHCVTEIKYLKQNKEKATKIRSDLQEREIQHTASKESIEQIQQQLVPLEKKLDLLQNRAKDVIQLQTDIEKLKSERLQMERTQAELRDAIEHEFTGTTAELQQLLKDFKNKFQEQQRTLKEEEARLGKVEDKMDALGQEKSSQLLDLGKMEQDLERHKQQTKKRDDLIRSLAQEYHFEGFEDRLGAEHVKKLVHLLDQQAKKFADEAATIRVKYETQERELQERIDSERNMKTTLETSKGMKNDTLKQNIVEVRSIKRELTEAAVSAQKLDEIGREIRVTEDELKDTEESVDLDSLRSQVTTLQKQKEELDVTRKKLDTEMNRMSLESTARTQLSVFRKDKTAKEEHIRRLKAKNEESLQHLLGDTSGGNLRHSMDDYIGRQSRILRETTAKLKNLTKRLAQVETDRTNQMDFLSRKEEEYKGYEQKIFNVCESQNFDEGLEKVETKMKQSQDTLGYLKGTEHVYKKYKSQLQRDDPPCPLCHRPFDSGDEVDELITELDSKLNLVPAKLERVVSEHEKFKSKYETMLQLKPLREAMAALADADLPRLKTKVKALSEQVQQLKSDIAQLEERLEVEEMDSSTATSLQPDIMMIDRYENEVRDLDKKIAMQAAKLSSGGDTDRSMQQVTSERETVNISLDSVSVSLERTRERLSDHSERVQKLKSTLNDLRSERLTIERDLQRRTQLEERCSELESSNHELTNDIKEADRQLQPLARRISELSRQKEELAVTKERQVDKEKAKQAKVSECRSDITSRQDEIKRYERDGKQEMLAECKERLRELEEKAEQLSSARDQVTAKIVATRQKLDTQKTQERELEDNMQLRRRQTELEETMRKMGALEEELGGLDVGNLEQERRSLLSQHNRLQERKNHAEGRLHGLREQIQQFKRDLEGDYKDAEKKYMDKKIDLRTTELAQKDLDKYYTALDRAVMSYHKTKMAEINKIIRELWKNTYRGNDIETIEIRSDEEESSGSMRRVYNYRVVMVKTGDTVLDMRGRCSAGQKVLSSLIIRLALAETFCLNCGILALDEPTTNLDRENIESLAMALVQIIKFRSRQCNFQLLVITHDEDFVELLGKSDYVEHFYKVSKNARGCSQLAMARVEDL